MTRCAFAFMAFVVGITLEMWFGRLGIVVPLCGWCVLYFSHTLRSRWILLAACIAGITVDSLYGRTFPVSTITIPAACLLCEPVLPLKFPRTPFVTALVFGSAYGVLTSMTELTVILLSPESGDLTLMSLLDVPPNMLLGAAGFAGFAAVLDAVASRIGEQTFYGAQRHGIPGIGGHFVRNERSGIK
ncbi:MAG: hypothetical protein MJ025_07015 [Victivallaceae bacterium]|nr:hypothetical protein [Victivallaceae bacterium]